MKDTVASDTPTALDSATSAGSYTEKSLSKLLLSNQIRELADYPKPVLLQDIGSFSWLFGCIARVTYGAVGSTSSKRFNLLRRIFFALLDVTVLVLLRIALYRWKVWRAANGTARAAFRNGMSSGMRYYMKSTAEITSFVTTTEREEPLIRVCLMLRLMKRYGACIELLLQRLKSGLPATETRRWLSFCLSEIQDEQSALELAPSNDDGEAINYLPKQTTVNQVSAANVKRTKLKYGVVLPTMFNSDVFRSSLSSLLNSDFSGEIVVVEEGNQPDKVCEDYCSQVPVTYVKHSTWNGTCGVANLGIESLDPETDVIIFAHSDLLWPPRWFEPLDKAWEMVFDSDRVGSIHLGVAEFYRASDTCLGELFLKGKYEDLIWRIEAMRESPRLMGGFPAFQLNEKDRGNLLGLCTSHWHEGVPGFMVGDSVLASFPRRAWSELGGFDVKMGVGVGGEMAYLNIRNRRWELSLNNAPIIHFAKTDTNRDILNPEDRAKLDQIMSLFPGRFEEKHGWDWVHLYYTFHGETLAIHCDEITAAVNELRFSDIDYLFDEFSERLKHKKLSECELTACPKRTACKYV